MFYKVLCEKTIEGYKSFLKEKRIILHEPEEFDASRDLR